MASLGSYFSHFLEFPLSLVPPLSPLSSPIPSPFFSTCSHYYSHPISCLVFNPPSLLLGPTPFLWLLPFSHFHLFPSQPLSFFWPCSYQPRWALWRSSKVPVLKARRRRRRAFLRDIVLGLQNSGGRVQAMLGTLSRCSTSGSPPWHGDPGRQQLVASGLSCSSASLTQQGAPGQKQSIK